MGLAWRAGLQSITPRHQPLSSFFKPILTSPSSSIHLLLTIITISISLSLSHTHNQKPKMEGLIPFVYRAIMQHKNGNQAHLPLGSWFNESPSASYMRLPGDSGRFQTSDVQLFRSEYGFSSTSSPSSKAVSTKTQVIVSSGVKSSLCCLTPRRVAAWILQLVWRKRLRQGTCF